VSLDMDKTPNQIIESEDFAEYQAQPANQYTKINAQQLAKSPILLDCLEAPDGFQFVQLDFHALEPMVLAHFSGCPTYRKLYASGETHDVYLYVSCKLLDKDGKIAAVYKPDSPTTESVKAAKKLFKTDRTVGKVFQLMSTYKAGAPAIHRKLVLNGVDITRPEVKANRDKYWGPELFGEVLNYEESLLAEVDQRDGWMLNGLGRPFVVTSKKEKDVVNTHTQSTGHDATDLLIKFVEQLARERNVPCIPVIPDYHDETIWMARQGHQDALAQCMSDAVVMVNDAVKFSVQLQGEPEITKTFTEFKGPDEVQWYKEKVELCDS